MEVASAALAALQADDLHSEVLDQGAALYSQQQAAALNCHEEAMKVAASLHNKEQKLAFELSSQRWVHKMHLSQKEAVRDVWQQRNELVQNTMIIVTLLFGCAYNTVVDGKMPAESNPHAVRAYHFFMAAALASLLASIVGLLAMYSRMRSYNIHAPLMRYPGCNKKHPTFVSFYECHCQHIHHICLALFYGGSLCTMVGCAVLAIIKFHFMYHDDVSGWLFGCISAVGVLLPLVGSKVWPGQTVLSPDEQAMDEMEEVMTAVGGATAASFRTPNVGATGHEKASHSPATAWAAAWVDLPPRSPRDFTLTPRDDSIAADGGGPQQEASQTFGGQPFLEDPWQPRPLAEPFAFSGDSHQPHPGGRSRSGSWSVDPDDAVFRR